jgi:hypothetical protein
MTNETGRQPAMHAVIGTIEIDVDRADEAIELLNSFAVPNATQAPGFTRGTWCRSADGTRGHSVVLFESEATAKAAAARAAQGPPPDAPVRFVSADVFEVLAQA